MALFKSKPALTNNSETIWPSKSRRSLEPEDLCLIEGIPVTKTEVLLQMIIISLLYQHSLLLHPTRNQPFPHPFRNLVFVKGEEISEVGNMGKSFQSFLFTELIKERMSEGLSSSDSPIWRIADQLFNKIEELVIGLRKHLHENIVTFLKDFPLILGKSY